MPGRPAGRQSGHMSSSTTSDRGDALTALTAPLVSALAMGLLVLAVLGPVVAEQS